MTEDNANAAAGASDDTNLIEELVKLKLTDPEMTNKELAEKLEIPLKNCRQLIKKLLKSGKLVEADQGAVRSSDKKNPATEPRSAPGRPRGGTSVIPELLKGTFVELQNLKSKPELNGRAGLLIENNLGAEKNRWQVRPLGTRLDPHHHNENSNHHNNRHYHGQVRDLGTGVDQLLKPENLSRSDPFLDLLAGDVRCLNEDQCDTLTKIVRRKVRKISGPMSWGNPGDEASSFTDLVGELLRKKAAPSSFATTDESSSSPTTTLFLDLAGFGHHLVVQIVQVKNLAGQQAGENSMSSDADDTKNKPLSGQGANFLQANSASYCARLFHCWVKCDTKGGGYTLKEWLRGEVNLASKNSEGKTIIDIASTKDDPIHPMEFKWLVGTEVFNFCSQIDDLRDALDDVVRSDLLLCAQQFVPSGDLTETRHWASSVKVSGSTKHSGLTLQPGFLAVYDDYVADMQSLGYPAHAVVYHGNVKKNPQQVLDFPAHKLKKILILGLQLFSVNVSAATFLSILEWWQQPEAWSCSVLEKM